MANSEGANSLSQKERLWLNRLIQNLGCTAKTPCGACIWIAADWGAEGLVLPAENGCGPQPQSFHERSRPNQLDLQKCGRKLGNVRSRLEEGHGVERVLVLLQKE
jgi:hypothetical protein